MRRAARFTRRLAFSLAVVLALLGSLFVAGYAVEDPGGWQSVGIVASYLLPMLALAAAARLWPSVAGWVMAGALALLAGSWTWYVVDTEAWTELMDDVGPILGVAMLVVLLPLGVLGLRRPLAAGLMLAGAAVLSYTAFVASVSDEPWYGVADSLTTSRTVLCAPMLLIGLLFLLAALFGRRDRTSPAGSGPPPAPPTASVEQGGVVHV